MNMEIKQLNINDIDLLIQLRMEVLADVFKKDFEKPKFENNQGSSTSSTYGLVCFFMIYYIHRAWKIDFHPGRKSKYWLKNGGFLLMTEEEKDEKAEVEKASESTPEKKEPSAKSSKASSKEKSDEPGEKETKKGKNSKSGEKSSKSAKSDEKDKTYA